MHIQTSNPKLQEQVDRSNEVIEDLFRIVKSIPHGEADGVQIYLGIEEWIAVARFNRATNVKDDPCNRKIFGFRIHRVMEDSHLAAVRPIITE